MQGSLTKYISGYPQNWEVCLPVKFWSVKMRLFFVYSFAAMIFQNSEKGVWKTDK